MICPSHKSLFIPLLSPKVNIYEILVVNKKKMQPAPIHVKANYCNHLFYCWVHYLVVLNVRKETKYNKGF